jgi:hypothetical protein
MARMLKKEGTNLRIRLDGDSLANSELCPQNCHGSAASAEKEVMNIDE